MESTDIECCEKKQGSRILIIGVGLVVFQQLCGMNPLIFHMEEIFNDLSSTDILCVNVQAIPILIALIQVNYGINRIGF